DSFLKFIHGPSTSSQYQYKYESLTKSYITNKYIELKTNSLPYDFTNIVRWYDIETEKNFKSSIYDKSVYLAIYYYFLRQYDIALCRFKDAFDVCDDIKIKLLLLTKISECFAYSDVDTAYNIMSDIIKYNNQEINDFINENYNYIIKKSAQSVIDKKSNFYAKIDFYNSIFPHSVAERYAKMTDKIKLSLFKNYSTTK
ncbi:MAG: hypothetical protein LBB66_03200, partial [Desulfovibrio sp.]|nr:hypothetical protein [Desulfovibrio sp.]